MSFESQREREDRARAGDILTDAEKIEPLRARITLLEAEIAAGRELARLVGKVDAGYTPMRILNGIAKAETVHAAAVAKTDESA